MKEEYSVDTTSQTTKLIRLAITQTDLSAELHKVYANCVNRMDHTKYRREEPLQNEEPPIATKNQNQTKLEPSHKLITDGINAPLDQRGNTDPEEDTRFYRGKTQKVPGLSFTAAAIRKERNMTENGIERQ